MSAGSDQIQTKIQISIDMARTVARLNIERFRLKLTEETDETKLGTLQDLLAEEEVKLAELI